MLTHALKFTHPLLQQSQVGRGLCSAAYLLWTRSAAPPWSSCKRWWGKSPLVSTPCTGIPRTASASPPRHWGRGLWHQKSPCQCKCQSLRAQLRVPGSLLPKPEVCSCENNLLLGSFWIFNAKQDFRNTKLQSWQWVCSGKGNAQCHGSFFLLYTSTLHMMIYLL